MEKIRLICYPVIIKFLFQSPEPLSWHLFPLLLQAPTPPPPKFVRKRVAKSGSAQRLSSAYYQELNQDDTLSIKPTRGSAGLFYPTWRVEFGERWQRGAGGRRRGDELQGAGGARGCALAGRVFRYPPRRSGDLPTPPPFTGDFSRYPAFVP